MSIVNYGKFGRSRQPLTGRLIAGSRVETNGCWIWMRYRSRIGYGTIHVGRKLYGTHRIAIDAEPDQQVNHRCNNAACLNPDHLYFGTQQENIEDCRLAGRMRIRGKELLSDDIVHSIRKASGVSQRKLAAMYKTSQTTIGQVRRGETYRWVTCR